MQPCQYTTPAFKKENDLTNVQLSLDGEVIFLCHASIICFGIRGSEFLNDRLTETLKNYNLNSSSNYTVADAPIIYLSDLIDIEPADVGMILDYIYNGNIPSVKLNTDTKVGNHTINKSNNRLDRNQKNKQMKHLDCILRLYNAANEFKVHTLVNELETKILEYVATMDTSTLNHLFFHKQKKQNSNKSSSSDLHHELEQRILNKFINVVSLLISIDKKKSESIMNHYIHCKRKQITKNDQIQLKNAIETHPSNVQVNNNNTKRVTRLRKLSSLISKKKNMSTNIAAPTSAPTPTPTAITTTTTTTIATTTSVQIEDVKNIEDAADAADDEIVEDGEDDVSVEQQRAVVVTSYTSNDGSITITKDEEVEVLYYDEKTGWAGIYKEMDGSKGYVPTYCVELIN